MHCRHRKSDSRLSFCVGLPECANKMPKKYIWYTALVCSLRFGLIHICFFLKYLDLAIITNATHELCIENASQSVHSLIILVSVPGTSFYWYMCHELHILYSVLRAVLAHPSFGYFDSHWAVQDQISSLIHKHEWINTITK